MGSLEPIFLSLSKIPKNILDKQAIMCLIIPIRNWREMSSGMNVFELRNTVIRDYENFSRSFTKVLATDISQYINSVYDERFYWPAPLIQLNPSFVPGRTVERLAADGVLDPECAIIFREGKKGGTPGKTLALHQHQEEAIVTAQRGESYVLTIRSYCASVPQPQWPARVVRQAAAKSWLRSSVFPSNVNTETLQRVTPTVQAIESSVLRNAVAMPLPDATSYNELKTHSRILD